MKNWIQARIPFQGTDAMVYTAQEIVTQLLIPFVVPPNRFDEIEFSPLALAEISLFPFFEPIVYFRPRLRLGRVTPVLALTAIQFLTLSSGQGYGFFRVRRDAIPYFLDQREPLFNVKVQNLFNGYAHRLILFREIGFGKLIQHLNCLADKDVSGFAFEVCMNLFLSFA